MSQTNQHFDKYSILLLAASACQIIIPTHAFAEATTPQSTVKASSALKPTHGHSVNGSVIFTPANTGVKISAKLSGLTEGAHGFHIHAVGDCSSGDGKSAGGHFNPLKTDHGSPDAEIRHIGDLGNIVADSKGEAVYTHIDNNLSLHGENSIIGKGMIVHAGEDDLTSQPTGAAGARVACGVIK